MPNRFEVEKAAVIELRRQAERERETGRENAGKNHGERGDAEFKGKSFLFMRSLQQDKGMRPISPTTLYWLSPDIRLRGDSLGGYTDTVKAGGAYEAEVTVRNRGDVNVPSATVELFLSTPTLGFDTRFSRPLGVTSTWVPAEGTATVRVPFTVASHEAGHKCLFARVFSFGPPDLPIANTELNPTLDRHVAQLNLNIVSAIPDVFGFNIVHPANFSGHIQFWPAALRDLAGAGHPILANVDLVDPVPLVRHMNRAATIRIEEAAGHEAKLDRWEQGFRITARGDGASLADQRGLRADLLSHVSEESEGRHDRARARAVLGEYRKQEVSNVLTRCTLDLPGAEMVAGTAAACHMQLVSELGHIVGGITFVVVA